jgi:hypothetical protein
MSDTITDMLDLHARRLLEEWERKRWRTRGVQWIDGKLLAYDTELLTSFEADGYVEMADRIGLGVQA